MKVLVLDALVFYMNPTRNLTPVLLSKLGDTTFFGPGYSSSDVLEKGLAYFLEKTGPYDLIVHTELAHPPHLLAETAAKFGKDELSFFKAGYVYEFSDSDLFLFWKDSKNFLDIHAIHVATLFQYDFQGMGKSMYEYLLSGFNALIGLGREYWGSNLECQKDFNYENTSYWSDLLEYHVVHSLGHFVAPNEFCFTGLALRKYEWSVLGVSYPSRKQARTILKELGVALYDGRDFGHYVKAARYRLGISAAPSLSGLRSCNDRFRDGLWNSKASYTCGSGVGFPIRKFFEIPAAGAVLVCDPCHGLESLGFENWVSCIVAQPNELPDVVSYLQREPEKAEAIARRGQELILEQHTVEARSNQIRDCLALLMKGEFYGSCWHAGKLKYKDSADS